MVFASVHCVRIWKQYQLGVRVHGYVGFNDVFVISDKASHGFHFRFRLWVGSAVCLLTFVGRSSFPCNKKVRSVTSYLLPFCISVCLMKDQSIMLIHKKSWTLPCYGKNSHAFRNQCEPTRIAQLLDSRKKMEMVNKKNYSKTG